MPILFPSQKKKKKKKKARLRYSQPERIKSSDVSYSKETAYPTSLWGTRDAHLRNSLSPTFDNQNTFKSTNCFACVQEPFYASSSVKATWPSAALFEASTCRSSFCL